MSKPTEIFVSYAWGGESERTVDELEAAFADHGLSIVRDKKELGYKGSIEAFEQRIGQGQAIILVISDKYLRSKHCMYELVEAAENRDLQARIFPIVLPDAQIYDAADRLAYIQYWDAEIAELNQAIKDVAVVANLKGITADLDLYDRIRDNIAELTDLLSDMNTLTPEIHAQSGYTTLIEAVEAEAQPNETKENDNMSKNDPAKKSSQTDDTGGVHVGSISGVSGGELNLAGGDIHKNKIDTGGGAYIGGSVNTGGGDFVGRDKITHASPAEEVSIEQFLALLEEISAALPASGLDPDEQEEVRDNLNKAAQQAEKPEPKSKIILSRLNSAVGFLADAATVATAAPQLAAWGQQAITWAGQLFK